MLQEVEDLSPTPGTQGKRKLAVPSTNSIAAGYPQREPLSLGSELRCQSQGFGSTDAKGYRETLQLKKRIAHWALVLPNVVSTVGLVPLKGSAAPYGERLLL